MNTINLLNVFISGLKNAIIKNHKVFSTKSSNQIIRILKCLEREGFIYSYDISNKMLIISLKDNNGKLIIQNVDYYSKPGKRRYVNTNELKKINQSFETLILSTSKGILSNNEAIKQNIGGELLFKII